MSEKNYCLITFESTFHALKAEKVLKRNNFSFEMVQTPREFSSSCGVAARLDWGDNKSAGEILLENNVKVEQICNWGKS